MSDSHVVLVLGGTRSGKSTYGAQRIAELAGARAVAYLATALRGMDEELEDRVRRHQAMRQAQWKTIEVTADLLGAVAAAGPETAVLLDGLTLWLAVIAGDEALDIDALLDGPVAAALESLVNHPAPVVVVSDEIGLGMVPIDAGARAFRDLQGIVHQRLAALADEVVFTVAGLPLPLKGNHQ